MSYFSRRRFLLAAAATSLASLRESPTIAKEPEPPPASAPDEIAGYQLTDEDKRLAEKFLASHKKNMTSLRASDLPNNLAPCFVFASLSVQTERVAKVTDEK